MIDHNGGFFMETVSTYPEARPTAKALETLTRLAEHGISDQLMGAVVKELLLDKKSTGARPVDNSMPNKALSADTNHTAEHPLPSPAASRVAAQHNSPDEARRPLTTGAVAGSATVPRSSPRPFSLGTKKDKRPSVIVDCRDSEGKRTTVCVTAERWEQLQQLCADEKQLRQHAKELAAQAPPGVPRSQWVFEQLMASLTKAAA